MNWPRCATALIMLGMVIGGGALAFLFAVGTGVFFGFYPARKAALLKPVEALGRE